MFAANSDCTQLYILYISAGKVWGNLIRKLALSNLTDLDPLQINLETGNVDINKFDTTLVVGQDSGARWISINAAQQPKAFDDADALQEEYNRIKIWDPVDANPFGFY